MLIGKLRDRALSSPHHQLQSQAPESIIIRPNNGLLWNFLFPCHLLFPAGILAHGSGSSSSRSTMGCHMTTGAQGTRQQAPGNPSVKVHKRGSRCSREPLPPKEGCAQTYLDLLMARLSFFSSCRIRPMAALYLAAVSLCTSSLLVLVCSASMTFQTTAEASLVKLIIHSLK